MTNQKLDTEIKKFEPNIKKGSDEHWAYRVLFSIAEAGPFMTKEEAIKKMEDRWGEEKRISTMVTRAANNRVFRYGVKFQKHFLDSEIYGDGLGAALGACILTGMLKRAPGGRK